MGDIADQLNEEGAEAYAAHLAGQCEGFCQYCEEEPERRSAPRRKSSGRRIADVPGRRVARRRRTDGKGHRSSEWLKPKGHHKDGR